MNNVYSVCQGLLFLMLITSCHGQLNSHVGEQSTIAPIIVGTAPPLFPHHNPYNDTGLVSQYIRSIFQDSKGNFWFGPAGQSVVRYSVDTLKYYSKAEFFAGNKMMESENVSSVHAITEDKEGNIWFGADVGVVKYDGVNFQSYTQEHGLRNTSVGRRSILTDKAGKVWVGTQAGVFTYSRGADTTGGKCFSEFQLLPSYHIKDIMEDKSGHVWFASQEAGVFRYDPNKNGKEAITNLKPKAGLGDNYAGGIASDPQGNIWFTIENGICKYDGKNFTEVTTKDGIGGYEIWGIFIEKSGIIWITTRGSTTRYDPSIPISDSKAFTIFSVENGLNCCVQSMYQDRDENMWWGTGQGLYRFDGKEFYQVKRRGPW